MSFDDTDWLAYRQANLLFAEAIQRQVHTGDIVWVQGEFTGTGSESIPELTHYEYQIIICASFRYSCAIY